MSIGFNKLKSPFFAYVRPETGGSKYGLQARSSLKRQRCQQCLGGVGGQHDALQLGGGNFTCAAAGCWGKSSGGWVLVSCVILAHLLKILPITDLVFKGLKRRAKDWESHWHFCFPIKNAAEVQLRKHMYRSGFLGFQMPLLPCWVSFPGYFYTSYVTKSQNLLWFTLLQKTDIQIKNQASKHKLSAYCPPGTKHKSFPQISDLQNVPASCTFRDWRLLSTKEGELG